MKFIILLISLITIFNNLNFTSEVEASGELPKNKEVVVLVLAHHLMRQDLEKFAEREFMQIRDKGAYGALTLISVGGKNDFSQMFSLAAGKRISPMPSLKEWYQAFEKPAGMNERAENIYHRRTGFNFSADYYLLSLPFLNKQENFVDWLARWPSSKLQKENIPIYVYGNADTTNKQTFAPLIALNNTGTGLGDISNRWFLADEEYPYGIKTNYNFLLKKVQKVKEKSLYVIELGDLIRLESEEGTYKEEVRENLRGKIVGDMVNFLNLLIRKLEQANLNSTVLFLAPTNSKLAREEKGYLTPLYLWDSSGMGKKSTFYSFTTRTNGISANIDIMPTILHLLLRDQYFIESQPLKITANPANLNNELRLHEGNYQFRPLFLKILLGFFALQIIFALFFWHYPHKFFTPIIIWLIALNNMLLTIFVIIPQWNVVTELLLIFSFVLVAYLLYFFSVKQAINLFLLSGLFLIGVFFFDAVNNYNWLRGSLLSYDIILAARFYGIGNELMGIMVGNSLLLLTIWRNKILSYWHYFLYYFVVIIIAVYLAHPYLGANAGGTITFVVSIVFFTYYQEKRSKKEKVLLLILGILFSLIILFFLNISYSESSHIGDAFSSLRFGSMQDIKEIIARKITINLKLIKNSIWSNLAWVSLVSLAYILFRRHDISDYNHFSTYKGFLTIFLAAILAFFVNDSGIVAFTTIILYVVYPLLISILIGRLSKNGLLSK